jgi:hypothetical protein
MKHPFAGICEPMFAERGLCRPAHNHFDTAMRVTSIIGATSRREFPDPTSQATFQRR